jgi:hypothetical protein
MLHDFKKQSFKRHLSAPGLLQNVYNTFKKIPDTREFTSNRTIPLTDHLMSGLAVFGLKCSSLLEFDEKRKEPPVKENLKNLYHVNTPPSDTYLRERLDEVDPKFLRPSFKKIFSLAQRGKVLEEFVYLSGHVLISGDGTGEFHSNNISCPCCCTKKSKDGVISYYHQMFGVCIVHPDKKNVIPLCPELIINQHDTEKNDCERNACKRFLENFRREHPHLKAILLEDGLGSTAPNIRMIEEHNLKYILGAKPGDHQFLFDSIENSDETKYYECTTEDGVYHQFRYLKNTPLNKSNRDVKVNVIEYRCTDKKGKEKNFSWVTNISITEKNILKIATAGRSRWKVENETFNTLKNLGYNFKHSYGHGKQYLSTIFCMLLMLAFLIDQIQELCCPLFTRCKKAMRTYRELWETMRSFFRFFCFQDWEHFYRSILKEVPLNTS